MITYGLSVTKTTPKQFWKHIFLFMERYIQTPEGQDMRVMMQKAKEDNERRRLKGD
jgi:hypothetical protein